MSPLKIFYCQSILLVALYRGCLCENDYIEMNVTKMKMTDGTMTGVFKNQVIIKPARNVDEYLFADGMQRLGSLKFTSQDIEIRYVFGPSLEFSLITPEMLDMPSKHLIIECTFKTNQDLQLFFSELRKTLSLEGPECVRVRKTFLFSNNARVKIANDNLFYQKEIFRSRELRATKSFNLVRLYSARNVETGMVNQFQEADLVFLPRTFNISPLFGVDKYGLCVPRVPNNSIFILRLANAKEAWNFFIAVARDINTGIPCSLDDDWIAERIEYIDAPQPFHMPNHPYLSSYMG